MSYLKRKRVVLKVPYLESGMRQTAKKQQEKLDPVNKVTLEKDFQSRSDKDIDNDGDVDSTDKYLHKEEKQSPRISRKKTMR